MDYPNQFHTNSSFMHPQCTCAYHPIHAKYPEPVPHYPHMVSHPTYQHAFPPSINAMHHSNALQSQHITNQLPTNYLTDPFQISVNNVNNVNNNNGSGSPTASNVTSSTVSSDNASFDNYYGATDVVGNGYNYNTVYPEQTMPNYGDCAGNKPWLSNLKTTHMYDSAVATNCTPPFTVHHGTDINPFRATKPMTNGQHLNGYPHPLRPFTPDYNENAFQPHKMRSVEDTKVFMNHGNNMMNAPNWPANDMKPTARQVIPTNTATKASTQGAYQCTVCAKRFKHKCNLKIHTIIHTPSALTCSFCNKKFARTSNLNEHTKIHTNFRPFKCQFCQKTFRQKQTLIDHIRTHTGERPFKCDFCNKAFKVKHNLKSHRRLHTGERPFICPLCPKKFASKSSLNGHIRRKHTEYWTNRHRTNCRG
eukprot:460904_1